MHGKRKALAALAVVLLLAGCASAGRTATIRTDSALLENPAELAGNPTLELIAASYSPRTFAAGEVAQEDLDRILQSGAKAPSAKNLQPWRFTVVRNEALVDSLAGQSEPGNVLIILSGEDSQVWTTLFDCGIAAENMVLAAQSLGLGARILVSPISTVDKDPQSLGIPEDFTPHAAILIGHVDDGADTVSSPSPRDPLAQLVNYVE